MGWNGAGQVVRTDGVRTGSDVAAQQKTAGVKVRADLHDAEMEDLATAIENTVARDGQNSPSANLPMGGFKHTGVTTSSGGSSRSEYTSGGVVQDGAILDAGDTGGTSTAFTATLSPAITAYANKQLFRVKFNAAFGSNPTINFNSVAAKKMYYMLGSTATQLTTDNVPQNYVALLRYDTALDSAAGAFLLLNPPPALISGGLASANTWTAAQTISLTAAGPALTLASSDAGASEGPSLDMCRNSATPAASDIIGAVNYQGEDSAGNTQVYAKELVTIKDATSTSENAQWAVQTVEAGTVADRLVVGGAGGGVQVGAPTSGDLGAGKLNVETGIFVGAAPAYMPLLATLTASSSATLDFTAVASKYAAYYIVFSNILPATDNTDLYMRISTDGGSNYLSTSVYAHARFTGNSGGATGAAGSASDSKIILISSMDNASGSGWSGHGIVEIGSGTNPFRVRVDTGGVADGGGVNAFATYGYATSTGPNAFRFVQSSGNIASGVIYIFGIAKS